MGHIGVKGLRHAAEGIDFDDTTHSSCTICARANIKRTPFPEKASHRATRLLQRIHCDVCGPLPSCYGNYRYFILFICCYSRYISVYFMKTRDEALQCFIEFRALTETFCREKTITLRVDNAPELTKGQFAAHCESEGITYEKTVPEAPSQNGVAERCNLTLASMARAMLIDSDLSDWFWPFAIQAAVHIKNRVPHSNLPPHKTPFEFWHGYKPNLSHLRHFGAYCTSRITPSNALQKFDPRGEPGRFLGYAKDAKGELYSQGKSKS
jgi:transposase InsO family protein